MLHTPSTRKPAASSLPTVMIVVACAAVACYFAFFRGKAPAPTAAPETPVAAAPAAPAPAPALKPATAAVDPLVVFNPPAPAPKPAPRVESPKPVQVAFASRGPSEEAAALRADGKWREARLKVAAAFGSSIPDAERMELGRLGMEINRQLLQEKPDPADVELYEIRQGDTLEGIARKFKSLYGVKGTIMLLNNYKENAVLREGRKVRIAKGTWSAVVDKSLFTMWLCYDGCPFKSYRITIGMEHKETPVTKFVVGNRNPKPAWWPPADMKVTGKIPVPYGDPQNPLGEWWISLEHDLHHGIGIHGTNDPASIGSKASNGCVRMLNDEVCEVAAISYKGMGVTVVE